MIILQVSHHYCTWKVKVYDRIKTTTSTVRQKNRKFQRFCIFKVCVTAYLIEMTLGREPVLLTSLNEDLTDHCIHIRKSFSGLLYTKTSSMLDRYTEWHTKTTSCSQGKGMTGESKRGFSHQHLQLTAHKVSPTEKRLYSRSKKISVACWKKIFHLLQYLTMT